MKVIYTATYLLEKDRITLRFIGKGMKQEYDTLEELEKAIKEANIKNVIKYTIYKHKVEEVMELVEVR